jgi:hypothetical protein
MTALQGYPSFAANDDFEIFIERLENAFKLNKTHDLDKVAVLLNQVDASVYKTLRSLCDPQTPAEKTFDQLAAILCQQCVRKTAVWKERRKFFNAMQKQPESVNAWFLRLKTLSTNCEFGSDLNEMLRSKFVCGLKSDALFEKIAEEDMSIDVDAILQIAINKETVTTNDQEISKNRRRHQRRGKSVERFLDEIEQKVTEVKITEEKQVTGDNKTAKLVICAVCGESGHFGLICPNKASAMKSPNVQQPANKICWYCGESNHDFGKCVHKNSNCSYCKETGHLRKICRHLQEDVKPKNFPVNIAVVPNVVNATHIQVIAGQNNPKPKQSCPHCGQTDHRFDTCRAKNKKCFNCQQVGHTNSICPYEKQKKRSNRGKNRMEEEEEEEKNGDCCIS